MLTGRGRNSDFSSVTEVGGQRGSRPQLERLYQRYFWASHHCQGKDVLEVGCGAGLGLGLLADTAKSVVGADIERRNLARAKETYDGRPKVHLTRARAEALPFANRSFDVVLLFEVLYYLRSPDAFVREARRVLRPGGMCLIGSANKDLPDFNPSPFSHRYFGPPEFSALLRTDFTNLEVYGGDPVGSPTARSQFLSLAKQCAVRLHLIPRTMIGKRFLKRLAFGPLIELPRQLEAGTTVYQTPVPISTSTPDHEHRVLYVLAYRER